MSRPTQALIDLAAFQHNYRLAKKLGGTARAWAIIKANGYGHGAVALAHALPDADGFGVASLEEAMELRAAGIDHPILLLGGCFEIAELPEVIRHRLDIVIHADWQLAMLEAVGGTAPLTLWLKIDTGMHRLGLDEAQLASALARLAGGPHRLRLMTHLASADLLDSDCTPRQIATFRRMTQDLPWPVSLANSAGLVAWPDSRADWVRPGIMLYGASPFRADHEIARQLRPVMTLTSRIVAIREVAAGDCVGYGEAWRATRTSRIGTVAIGYGDGYPRHAPSGTPLLINGERAWLAGRVSMDSIGVDLTHLPGVRVGDEVVLWGDGLDAGEVAQSAGTIAYELFTGVTQRVPRHYRD